MAQRIALSLWLLSFILLIGNTGCTKSGDIDLKKRYPKLDTLSLQAMHLWQGDIDLYRQYTSDPKSLRPQAEEFMRTVQLGMLPNPRGPGIAKTVEMGKKLLEQGCQDRLVKMYYGRAICSDQGILNARPVLFEALNSWGQSNYPPECRRMGVFTIYGEAKTISGALPWAKIRSEVAKLAAARVSDETIGPEMRRIVFHELLPLLYDNCGRDWEGPVAIYEACSKQPKADPWLINMIAGRSFVAQAWHHRGGEWAYKVTPEGWKLFHENLQKAAQYYAEAIKLHPEYPEAASEMITAAMAGESDKTPQEWFDKAVAAQIDYMPAYKSLKWALRPRWYGSHEEMYRFGCRCADTQRYDTYVPMELLYVLSDIDEEFNYNWEVWRRNGVYDQIKTVLTGMADDPSRSDDDGLYPTKSSVKSINVAIAIRAERFDEAKQLVDELGDRFDRRIFDTWFMHPNYEFANIYAFSGKGSDDVKKAWKMIRTSQGPLSNQVLEDVKRLFQKARDADDNEQSKTICQSWADKADDGLTFNAGNCEEKKFDPMMFAWSIKDGFWSRESERSAIGHPLNKTSPVLICPGIARQFPLEIEFDVEVINIPRYPLILGLFIPEADQQDYQQKTYQQYFIRTSDNQAGINIVGKEKTVSCNLKQVNRIHIQLADGRAVLYVNDELCLERNEPDFHPLSDFNLGCLNHLYPNMSVRISNVRIRKWEPPKEETPITKETKESKEETPVENDKAKQGENDGK
jgi:hypothetical protein